MRRRIALTTSSLVIGLMVSGTVLASIFPDVPDTHPYREAIETLVGMQVIGGNPDGNFSPERSVNRAEMLKMLYKATGKTPRAVYANCFADVEKGSWYELYVCDAAVGNYVQGYSDGTFRPGNPVNRVEALKMIMEIFDLPVEELSDESRAIVKFVDVSTSAWYTKYLYTGFSRGILPIAGQVGARFYPEWPLLRGEAAAYIYNTLTSREESHEEAATEQSSSAASTSTSTIASVSSQQSSKDEGPRIRDVSFPFSERGSFAKKEAVLYRFSLDTSAVADIQASMREGYAGGVICRLYRLNDESFSLEYYLGHQEGSHCYLLAALSPGTYQLQLQPTVGDTQYEVSAKVGTGDGNDGFRQAKLLIKGTPKTEFLDANDYADWYRFTLSQETTLTLEVLSGTPLQTLIYPMEDVDIYGFSGPQANASYKYPAGTYYVGVLHSLPRAARQTYTIWLK